MLSETFDRPLRNDADVNVVSIPRPGIVNRNWLSPDAFQLVTDSVAPPAFAAVSGTMPFDVALITVCFKGNAVPPNGCAPDGDGVEFVPAVAASGCIMVGTVPAIVAMGTLSSLKLIQIFDSEDPLPNVVLGDAVVVPPAAPDDELEITAVAGAPPPPPPPHAAKTNTPAAAAKCLAIKLCCIFFPLPMVRITGVEVELNAAWVPIVPLKIG